MLILLDTDILELVTGQVRTVDVHASFVDWDGTDATPGRKDTLITTATTTMIVGSPAATKFRTVKTLFIRNREASDSVDVTLQHDDGSANHELLKVTLVAGQTLVYAEGVGFVVIEAGAFLPLAGGTMTGQFVSAIGSLSTPGIAFTDDLDTGLTWIAPDTFSLVAGGVNVLRAHFVPTAINFFSVVPAITGERPVLTVSGADTDIGVKFAPKGMGKIEITANELLLATDPISGLGAATKQYVDAARITTLKTGSGAGNYTNAVAGYADVDATNLAFTVTVATGRKLIIRAMGTIGRNGAASGTQATVILAIADGTTALIESGDLSVDESNGTTYENNSRSFALQWVFNGDGAEHIFKLRWNPNNTIGVFMANSSSTIKPVMIFEEVSA